MEQEREHLFSQYKAFYTELDSPRQLNSILAIQNHLRDPCCGEGDCIAQ